MHMANQQSQYKIGTTHIKILQSATGYVPRNVQIAFDPARDIQSNSDAS